MNLGEANLRTVSTSKPALVHTSSKQSIAASDDYYSLSSGASSQDEKSAAGQYQTPPLHIIPEPYRRGDDPAPSKPTVRAVTPTLPLAPSPAHLPASAQAHKIKRKPVSTESHPSSDRPSNNEPISPPTPGVDDTPYIQFAIDQLTRDQEVNEASKPRLHGLPSHESYPVDRIVPDERLRLQQGLQSAARKQPSLRSIRRLSDTSGLRWDPRSLADIVVLFQRSNVLSEFYGSEARRDDHGTALLKKYTLRYWIAGKRSSEIFHGIEEAQAALHGFRLHQRSNEKHSYQLDLESQRPLKASTLDSLQKDVHSPLVRYRWLPWFLKDTFVVAWIVIAIVLMLAFIIVSFVNSAVVRGFMPMLPSPTTSQGFSPSDFLYSFVPSIIGMLLFLLWQPIDLYFRALEPFAQLGGSTRGSPADESLLLDYTACLPAEVTIKAALAGHYKVAWISFISLMSATLPILSGGIFTAQYFIPSREVRVAADMSGYYALVVFVAIYALSFLVVWPGKNRRLPHDIRSLGQILSFMYESRLLNDATFWQPRSKVDLVTRLLGTLTGDRGSSKYAFGVYRGRDGKEHLGIDRLHRPESGEMFIATAMMK
ncbi:MAG: hypothetical protein Q9179_004965 [Wetmoreana sp. 5 TL-2023]